MWHGLMQAVNWDSVFVKYLKSLAILMGFVLARLYAWDGVGIKNYLKTAFWFM